MKPRKTGECTHWASCVGTSRVGFGSTGHWSLVDVGTTRFAKVKVMLEVAKLFM